MHHLLGSHLGGEQLLQLCIRKLWGAAIGFQRLEKSCLLTLAQDKRPRISGSEKNKPNIADRSVLFCVSQLLNAAEQQSKWSWACFAKPRKASSEVLGMKDSLDSNSRVSFDIWNSTHQTILPGGTVLANDNPFSPRSFKSGGSSSLPSSSRSRYTPASLPREK